MSNDFHRLNTPCVYSGDAVVSNPVSWHIADLSITLPESGARAEPGPYQLKPEIKHTFRYGPVTRVGKIDYK